MADSAPALVRELNNVLLPTLGRPTIPNFIFIFSSFQIHSYIYAFYIQKSLDTCELYHIRALLYTICVAIISYTSAKQLPGRQLPRTL